MPDDFVHRYGRSLVSFARETAVELKWDRGYVYADGSVSLERMVEARLITGRSRVDSELRRPPALVAVIKALKVNRLGLVADGGETLGHAVDLMVPPGLLRGDFVLVAVTEAGAYLRALDPNGREVGARYYRPRFAPPVGPAVETSDKKPPRREKRGDGAGIQKKKPATFAAEMIDWFDSLSPRQQRNKTPNALADLYLKDPSRRGTKRWASKVFANPDKYRGRSGGV
jgi:hypothetical protein